MLHRERHVEGSRLDRHGVALAAPSLESPSALRETLKSCLSALSLHWVLRQITTDGVSIRHNKALAGLSLACVELPYRLCCGYIPSPDKIVSPQYFK